MPVSKKRVISVKRDKKLARRERKQIRCKLKDVPVVDKDILQLKTKNNLSLSLLTAGCGTVDDIGNVTGALTIAVEVSERHYDGMYMSLLERALALSKQAVSVDMGLMYNPEHTGQIADAMFVHDEQLSQMTYGELVEVLKSLQSKERQKAKNVRKEQAGVTQT